MTSKAEELWEKYLTRPDGDIDFVGRADFLAALREYGAAVRARDKELCREKIDPEWPNDDISNMASDCAAAIDREPLP